MPEVTVSQHSVRKRDRFKNRCRKIFNLKSWFRKDVLPMLSEHECSSLQTLQTLDMPLSEILEDFELNRLEIETLFTQNSDHMNTYPDYQIFVPRVRPLKSDALNYTRIFLKLDDINNTINFNAIGGNVAPNYDMKDDARIPYTELNDISYDYETDNPDLNTINIDFDPDVEMDIGLNCNFENTIPDKKLASIISDSYKTAPTPPELGTMIRISKARDSHETLVNMEQISLRLRINGRLKLQQPTHIADPPIPYDAIRSIAAFMISTDPYDTSYESLDLESQLEGQSAQFKFAASNSFATTNANAPLNSKMNSKANLKSNPKMSSSLGPYTESIQTPQIPPERELRRTNTMNKCQLLKQAVSMVKSLSDSKTRNSEELATSKNSGQSLKTDDTSSLIHISAQAFIRWDKLDPPGIRGKVSACDYMLRKLPKPSKDKAFHSRESFENLKALN